MDAFMNYVLERARQRRERDMFRRYVADSVHLHGKGMYIGQTLGEMLHPPERFDPEEVLAGVIEGAGLEVIE